MPSGIVSRTERTHMDVRAGAKHQGWLLAKPPNEVVSMWVRPVVGRSCANSARIKSVRPQVGPTMWSGLRPRMTFEVLSRPEAAPTTARNNWT